MRQMRYVRVITETLRDEMARDDDVFLIGEDIGAGGGAFSATRGLLQQFGPERVRDAPISEAAIAGIALGAALGGMRPVVEIMFMDFLALCMDQIVNQIAKARYMFGSDVPLTIRTPSGAANYAGPQHSQCFEAWFAHVPGLKVVAPSTAGDLRGLLKASIRDDNPVLFIESRRLYPTMCEIPDEDPVIPLGRADVKRPGRDVSVVAVGSTVLHALAAADALAAEGIDAEVVDLRTLLPLDKETILASVAKTHRLVIAHEAVKVMGIGAEIAAMVAEEGLDSLDAPIKRIGAPFTPVPYGRPLEDLYLPSSADIVAAVKGIVG